MKKKNLSALSWELFLKTGDPFYFSASKSFDDSDCNEDDT